MMKFIEILGKIPRRIIYILIALGVALPLVLPLNMPIRYSRPVLDLYKFIDNLPEGSVIVLSIDYAPDVLPECHPMAMSIARHSFYKNLRLVVLTLNPAGTGLGLEIVEKTSKEFNKEMGKDYVYLGYFPDITATILGFGTDIVQLVKKDYFGNLLDTMEIFKGVKNYDDIALVISFAGSAIPLSWMSLANARYGQKIACGVTAVMAADFYPYLRTGQFIGLLAGMRGAAEYEKLVAEMGAGPKTAMAVRGMDAISISHILIILFVIIGNLSYFLLLRSKK